MPSWAWHWDVTLTVGHLGQVSHTADCVAQKEPGKETFVRCECGSWSFCRFGSKIESDSSALTEGVWNGADSLTCFVSVNLHRY